MPTQVLIADDNEVVRGLIRELLERLSGIQVCAETGDGGETVEVALRMKPDLVILDVLMPKLNGIEVASILSKKLPSAKMILFTMYGEYVRTLAYAAGVDIVLPKPDGLSPLKRAVESVLH